MNKIGGARMKLLIRVLILLFGVAMFCVGYAYYAETVEPTVKYVEVERIVEKPYPVTKEVLVYVDRVEEVEVEKEVIRWRNIFPREFESLEQFKEWYSDQGFYPLLPSPAYTVDCDDYAERVQRKALQQGYSISSQLSPDKSHIFNMVIIGNDIYYLDSSLDPFKIWKVAERD